VKTWYLNGVSVDLSALEQIISATLKRSNEALLSRSAQKMTRRELWESPRNAWPPIRLLEPVVTPVQTPVQS